MRETGQDVPDWFTRSPDASGNPRAFGDRGGGAELEAQARERRGRSGACPWGWENRGVRDADDARFSKGLSTPSYLVPVANRTFLGFLSQLSARRKPALLRHGCDLQRHVLDPEFSRQQPRRACSTSSIASTPLPDISTCTCAMKAAFPRDTSHACRQ